MTDDGDRSERITLLLREHREGDREAFDRLVPLVYPELKRIARRQLRDGKRQTLATTALVHEAWFRLVDERSVDFRDRAHFFGVSARVMRRIVVDEVRRALATKRGGSAARVPLETARLDVSSADAETIVLLDDALDKLASFNERLARILECRFFGGMTEEEIATALDVHVRTVQRDGRRARAWLHTAMTP